MLDLLYDKRPLARYGGNTYYDCGNSLSIVNKELNTIKGIPIPRSAILRILSSSGLIRRFLRLGVHHLLPTEFGEILFLDKDLYLLNDHEFTHLARREGGRPLCICLSDNFVYYGEYTANVNRDPVNLYRLDLKSKSLSVYASFTDIRHIHGVFKDPDTKHLWITTGDNDNECAIIKFDIKTKKSQLVFHGSQLFRAVSLVFHEDYIYYATDAPSHSNYICRVDRSSLKVEVITKILGPVFYGFSHAGKIYFSSVVEPQSKRRCGHVEIIESEDGLHWRTTHQLTPDGLPLKLFQYPQLKFPYIWEGEDPVEVYCQGIKRSEID